MSDYIDRAALGIGSCNRDVFENKSHADGWNAAVKILQEAPAVDVQKVRNGEWKKFYPKNELDGSYYCSFCGHEVDTADGAITPLDIDFNYCPHCGAKMNGVTTMAELDHGNVQHMLVRTYGEITTFKSK